MLKLLPRLRPWLSLDSELSRYFRDPRVRLAFAALVAAWWFASHSGHFSAGSMPTPESVVAAARDLASQGVLQADVFASLGRLVMGAFVSIVLGVGLGILAGLNRYVGDLLLPLAAFFSAVSGIAWIPLAIMWFGLGTVAVTFVIWNSIFFLVFFNTVLGDVSFDNKGDVTGYVVGGKKKDRYVLYVWKKGADGKITYVEAQ